MDSVADGSGNFESWPDAVVIGSGEQGQGTFPFGGDDLRHWRIQRIRAGEWRSAGKGQDSGIAGIDFGAFGWQLGVWCRCTNDDPMPIVAGLGGQGVRA